MEYPLSADLSAADEEEVAAIQAGIDDMNAGRVRSLREWDREFRTQHNIPTEL